MARSIPQAPWAQNSNRTVLNPICMGQERKLLQTPRPAAHNFRRLFSNLQVQAHCVGVERVQIQSSSVVQAVPVLELRGCCSLVCISTNHLSVAGPSYRLSRNTISLRRPVECLVRWSWAMLARDGVLRSHIPLLLSATDPCIGFKASRNAPSFDVHRVEPSYRTTECCAKEGQRIDR